MLLEFAPLAALLATGAGLGLFLLVLAVFYGVAWFITRPRWERGRKR